MSDNSIDSSIYNNTFETYTIDNTIYSVIFYYLLIISNFTDSLLSNDLQNLIKNNRSIKHLFGLILLIMSINKNNYTKKNTILHNIGIGIICYIYFIFSTKMVLSLNLILIFIMIVFYYIEKYTHKNLNKKDNFLIKNKKIIRISFIIFITLIIIIGNIHYFVEYYNENHKLNFFNILAQYIFDKN